MGDELLDQDGNPILDQDGLLLGSESESEAGTGVDALLLEIGDYLLLEVGDHLLLEQQSSVVAEETPTATGGWLFLNTYDSERQRRRASARRRKELEEETEAIQDKLDRDIALLLREQEAIDAKRDDLKRLGDLAKIDANLEAARAYSERVGIAYARAISKGTYSALEALDRELARAREEEEFLYQAVVLLVD